MDNHKASLATIESISFNNQAPITIGQRISDWCLDSLRVTSIERIVNDDGTITYIVMVGDEIWKRADNVSAIITYKLKETRCLNKKD